MVRVLIFLLAVLAAALGFAWLADRPGELVVTFGGYRYEVTLMVAAVLVAALVVTVMVVWWLVKGILNAPNIIARHFRVRRRDRGYQALSTGMIAAGAGDGSLARKMNRQAAKLISSDREPLIHLLEAQALLLDGDHEGAREKFQAMVDDPEMRLLGLRGLYLEAERLGNREAARHYAGRAAELAPQLAWAATATLEQRSEQGDWDGALKLLDAQKSTRQIDREAANRRKAVLLTAKAMSTLDTDPLASRNAAVEANRLAPDLVPAALAAARALFRQNDLRKGTRILEASWKREPHAETAELYLHARPGDSVEDRLARAKRLASLRPNNVESSLAVARAALDAGDYKLARENAEAALGLGPREAVYLMLADIEEAAGGDQGKVRQYLAQALRAPADPAWVADGHVSLRWAPISPVTGRLDAFEWKPPADRIGPAIEHARPPEAPRIEHVAEAPAEAADAPFIDVLPAEEEPRADASPAASSPAASADRMAGTPRNGHGPAGADAIRPPDDPGVDDGAPVESASRFRLF